MPQLAIDQAVQLMYSVNTLFPRLRLLLCVYTRGVRVSATLLAYLKKYNNKFKLFCFLF